jgi:drug/metabolite transporter (DMT)-like permease
MNWTALGWLLMLGAIWGASFLFIKIGVSQMGPMTFATARVLIGSGLLYIFCRLNRAPWPRDARVWGRFAVMGALGILVPFAAISWGTQFIPSGLSAILNASMPLFTVIIAMVWGDEGASLTRVLGVLLGFVGIALLTLPELQGGIRAALLGEIAIVLASLSYAIAIVYARGVLRDQPPLVASFGQVSMGCLFFLPLALLERPWTMSPSTEAIGAMIAIGALGTAVAYVIYYRLLQSVGATMTSIVTYIVPVFGVFWGRVILSEHLSWHAFAALGLIFAGLGLIRRAPPQKIESSERTLVGKEGHV